MKKFGLSMKLAIGLGVVAFVIAVVGLVWILTRVPAEDPIQVRQSNGLPRIQAAADIDATVFAVLERNGMPSASIAVVDGDGIRYMRAFGPPAEVKPVAEVAGLPTWALGWGGFAAGEIPARFHVGYEEKFENYTVLYPSLSLGLVVLTSGGQRLQAVSPELVRAVLGETADPFEWMGY